MLEAPWHQWVPPPPPPTYIHLLLTHRWPPAPQPAHTHLYVCSSPYLPPLTPSPPCSSCCQVVVTARSERDTHTHTRTHTHMHTHSHTNTHLHVHTQTCAHTHTHRAVGRAGGCGWSCGCSELHTEACEAWWHHKPECFVCWCSDLISCLFVASLTWSSVLLNCIIDLICTCILSARFIYRRRSWSSLPMKCFLGEHGITSLCGGKCSAMSLCRLFVRADRLKQNLGKASLSFLFLCFRIYFIMKYLITKSSSW